MPTGLKLPVTVRRAMIEHAKREHPQECCGLLLGSRREIQFAVPMRNVAASATRYRIDDASHIELRRVVRAVRPRLDIVGVYHSHPTGPVQPSATDIDEAMYPEWAYFIVGVERRRAIVRAFQIRRGAVRTLRIR
jgi:[CysO sulfur-carrier protein]-S-L-cysteine hydrolase